jgi:hypothetical protein
VHCEHRHQVQERRIRLIGFDDDVVAAAEPRVRAGRIEASADDEGRIEPARRQDARDQAGGRRLAVRAGDRNPLLQPHQFGQHHRARDERHAGRTRGEHFWVVRGHCGRHDDGIRALDVRGRVPLRDRRTELCQSLSRCIGRRVGTAHPVTERQQHFRDAAHAAAADSDEVNVFDGVLHVVHCSCTRACGSPVHSQ